MNDVYETGLRTTIHGQLLQLSAEHQVAIYSRCGVSWVAEFRNGHCQITDAGTWFRFDAGALRYSHDRRTAALESATPLTPEVIAKIERWHQIYGAKEAMMPTSLIAILKMLKRCRSDLVSRFQWHLGRAPGNRVDISGDSGGR